MSKSLLKTLGLSAILMTAVATANAGDKKTYGFGVDITKEELAGWDIDIRPDGLGLPEGSGTVEEGLAIYEEQCASCHGEFADGGGGRYPPLVGGFPEDLAASARGPGQPHKTIASYWPYASTIFDYIRRAMPFGNAQSLTNDQVYALTGYLLSESFLFKGDVMDRETLTAIKLPNEKGFYDDPRPDVKREACMKNCLSEVKIISKAAKVGVTPEGEDALR